MDSFFISAYRLFKCTSCSLVLHNQFGMWSSGSCIHKIKELLLSWWQGV